MKKFLLEILTSDSNRSSSRTINLLGAVLAAILITIDTYLQSRLSEILLGIFLTYCGGGYLGGKYIDSKEINDVDTKQETTIPTVEKLNVVIKQFSSKDSFPVEGELGVNYVDKSTSIVYTWETVTYTQIGEIVELS